MGEFKNEPRLTGIKAYSQFQDSRGIARTLASLLAMPTEEMIGMFKSYSFYESEYTPMVKSFLRIYEASKLLTDKQRVALAMYLASQPR